MSILTKRIRLLLCCLLVGHSVWAQPVPKPDASRPWVFWYWMQAGVSKEGITADLEAMQQAGIGGAYLMPIKGATNPPTFSPATEQLSPRWWEMVRHSMREAKRLGLHMGMHVSDGFALAGGPWITPELSMQKVVYSTTTVQGGQGVTLRLPQPTTIEGYYRDIAVYAYPNRQDKTPAPVVTSNKAGVSPQFLVNPANKEAFRSDTTCWIQFAYDRPFTCRSVLIRTGGNNYQAHRLKIEVSDDGKTFRSVGRLTPPRHGWQDTDADLTHAITPVTARFFRFTYDKAGSEPGAEDLDAAKWKPGFKLIGLIPSAEARIDQFEGKSAAVWRVSERSTSRQIPVADCVPPGRLLNLTKYMDATGQLTWQAPAGAWTILRMGHTSTGHTNATGGAAKGLECDKFNPDAIRLQFDRWYGEALRQLGPDRDALTTFHVDSWECGSQNWSAGFAEAFRKRWGYDLLPWLPVMAGVPVGSAEASEQVLYDVRCTVAELTVDVFYKTLAGLAKAQGVAFTAESVAPTMVSDGLSHYRMVDIPMGEFWLNSPTHDKPNDMLDAVSAAHIYGKNIVQAEGFTTVRMDWSEHPGMLKTVQDRNYALGINKLVYHVFTHNPWLDRKPGMTLDGVGLYFQRDQTWWKPGKAWVDYAQRCQALLQRGRPVADVAVFTGDDVPSRSVLPDRLVSTLPGVFGPDVVAAEQRRLANVGEPMRQKPAGVSHSANMADPENWVDPLRGYAYDSFGPDALHTLASVTGNAVQFANGTAYRLLILPRRNPLQINNRYMTPETATKLLALVEAGATILVGEAPALVAGKSAPEAVRKLADRLWSGPFSTIRDGAAEIRVKTVGRGRVVQTPFMPETFAGLGIAPDIQFKDDKGAYARHLAWTHRVDGPTDIYFLANQEERARDVRVSFRVTGKQPEFYDAVTDTWQMAGEWKTVNGRTELTLRLEPNASVFVVFTKPVTAQYRNGRNRTDYKPVMTLTGSWQVAFDATLGGPSIPQTFTALTDWSQHPDSSIRYYSGTATYTQAFDWSGEAQKPVWLDLGRVDNLADVTLNGQPCDVVWTFPYRVEVSKYLKPGKNTLTIAVTNTWANRLIGDSHLLAPLRITNTTAPFRLGGKPLLPAGLSGPVRLLVGEE
ncbi:glycosyl hydrolase [Arsenicibacter rosenii]|uniref:DNA-binding protein n=1 Tax=Arsenicibacter rosenii TaxID=1750698 RepID=A0A1S2VJY6_9BACT|nr:glycosyl hydrolase [Arsenicibacter rosenii]OIN58700.1 DNA-binding protein [Arsenicibacter rosenii]